jgi:nitric oxide reductase activation protein
MIVQTLPESFLDLEPLIDWSLERERQRTEKREASTMDEVRAFYDAVFPRMEEIVAHLDAFPLDALPEKEQRLFLLTLSLVEVSNLVERYKRREAIIAVSPLDYSSVQ